MITALFILMAFLNLILLVPHPGSVGIEIEEQVIAARIDNKIDEMKRT